MEQTFLRRAYVIENGLTNRPTDRPINNVTHQVNLESKSALYNHLYAWLLTGCLGMIVLLTWHASSQACWAGIILYGIGNGPCVGYCCE